MAGSTNHFSLRRRLTGSLALLLLAVLMLLVLATGFGTRLLVEHYIQTRLQHDAESLLTRLRPHRGMAMGMPQQFDQVFQRPYSGHYFVVVSDDQELRSRSLWEYELVPPQLAAGESVVFESPGPDGQQLLVRAQGYSRGGQDMVILVAEDISGLQDEILRWLLVLGGLGLIGLAVALVLQSWLLRRGFASLDRITAGVIELEQGLREQLPEDGPAEVLPLVRAVDAASARLRERIARSGKAAGDLAHALKKHLALLAQERDELAAAGHSGEAARLDRQLSAIRERMDAELRRARISGQVLPGAAFRPERDVPPLVDTMRSLHRERTLDIAVMLEGDGSWPVAREDMLELLGNLLDNACKWAAGRVRLQCQRGAEFRCVVEDDGPGVPDEEREQLIHRGTRLDESTGGHGLGLAIAADIVEMYQGGLQLRRSTGLGGLAAEISIPASH